MRKTKKLSALIIAACMSVGLAVPLNVGGVTADAAEWKCGDVDNDGQLTMMDQVSLNKYLAGKIELVDYTKADTNADCLVDIVDSKILRMRLAEQISALPYTRYGGGSQYANVGAQSVNESEGYTVFNAKTGNYMSSYTLDANPIKDNTREVLGKDDRYRDDSLPGVVAIIVNGQVGTGFVVDAHTIATAAHCVYALGNESHENSKMKVEKIVILDRKGNVEKEITDMYAAHVPDKFIDKSSRDTRVYDYALITVEEDLSEYACFDLGLATDGMMSDSQKLYSTGFPSKLGNNKNVQKRFTGEGFMKPNINLPFPERRICYDIDSTGGNSGGPVYVKNTIGTTTYYTVVGINAYSIDADNNGSYYDDNDLNSGTRITTELLHFYKNNQFIEWGE